MRVRVAVSWALSQIGTPYVWGGETPGVGFDCSGLVQAAYAVAGVSLPRVAQDQYDATPKLAPGAVLVPGDLVFFGGGPDSIDHVGLYVGVVSGQNVMVDAPAHRCRRPRRALSRDPGFVLWELAVCRGDATDLIGTADRASRRRRVGALSVRAGRGPGPQVGRATWVS